jgi:hypothetical protein
MGYLLVTLYYIHGHFSFIASWILAFAFFWTRLIIILSLYDAQLVTTITVPLLVVVFLVRA